MKLTTQDFEQIEQWIAALRSGEYKQGRMMLQQLDKYCCLGVACKVIIPKDKLKFTADGKEIYGSIPDGQPSAPKWLKEINPAFTLYYGDSLIFLNDSKEATFTEIANLVERFINHLKQKQDASN